MGEVLYGGFLTELKAAAESQCAQLMVLGGTRGGLLTVGNDYADGLRL